MADRPEAVGWLRPMSGSARKRREERREEMKLASRMAVAPGWVRESWRRRCMRDSVRVRV